MESHLLENRVAFVTGGSRGIGAAICRRLAENGAALAVNYKKNRAAAEALVDEIARQGASALAVPADIADPRAAAKALELAARKLGPIDILVHNAWPGWRGGAIDQVPWQTYQWYLDEMLRPAVELTRAALPAMQAQRWGRIILLGTTSMYELNLHHTPYLAAKGALLALTRGLARDLGSFGINVNMVSPSLVWTGDGPEPPGFSDAHRERSALGRTPTPAEVAGAVVFLASPLADAITGVQLPVSCGSPMHVG